MSAPSINIHLVQEDRGDVRRAARRVWTELDARVQCHSISARTVALDASLDGAFLQRFDDGAGLRTGDILNVEFEDALGKHRWSVDAEIRWQGHSSTHRCEGYGIVFRKPEPSLRAWLAREPDLNVWVAGPVSRLHELRDQLRPLRGLRPALSLYDESNTSPDFLIVDGRWMNRNRGALDDLLARQPVSHVLVLGRVPTHMPEPLKAAKIHTVGTSSGLEIRRAVLELIRNLRRPTESAHSG